MANADVDDGDGTGRRRNLAARRASLDGWRARLAADKAGWKAKHELTQEELSGREALLEQRRSQLEVVQQRRNKHRKQEVAELSSLHRCEEAHSIYLERRLEIKRRWAEQEEARRELAAQSLALEQSRDEIVHGSPDPARTANALEKLRKRERARLDADARALDADRRRFQHDLARLEADAQKAADARRSHSKPISVAGPTNGSPGAGRPRTTRPAARRSCVGSAPATPSMNANCTAPRQTERLARLLIEDGESGPSSAA